MFTVEQIAARLDHAFQLLGTGTQSAPPRQQTLRATLDWSYGLLSQPEKLLLDRLSVFAGGWTFEAAEAVAGTDDIQIEDILDLLGRLIDKSLVEVAEPDVGGNVRYRMLEVLRQYGQERLAERAQTNATGQRHAAYFLDLAEPEPRVLTADRKAWLDRLEQEFDNFRAARRWFVSSRDADGAQGLAARLYRLWMYRGYAKEGQLTLVEALGLPEGSPTASARAWFCLGGVAFIQADYSAAGRALEESLMLWREIGDQAGMAWSLMGLGSVATSRAEFDTATSLLEAPAVQLRLLGDFSLLCGHEPVTQLASVRLQSLLAYLALHRDASHSRQHLAFLFWPDATEQQARNNLRQLVHQLRHVWPTVERYLTTDASALTWRRVQPHFDVAEFEDALARADDAVGRAGAAAERAALEGAVGVYRGDLLPACYDDWLGRQPDLQNNRAGARRQQLFEALARAVLAADQPLLLRLDDLQWCDEDTLEWLHYLLRFDPRARLLVVGTARAEEIEAGHALAALLVNLRGAGHWTRSRSGRSK